MAAQANLVLNDGQTTPVAKTFSSNGAGAVEPSVNQALWQDKTSGIAIGFPTITLRVRLGSQMNEVRKKIVLPTLEVISGSDGGYTPSPKVAYEVMSDETFKLPSRCTQQNRKDVLAFSANFNGHAVMKSAVHDLEPVW